MFLLCYSLAVVRTLLKVDTKETKSQDSMKSRYVISFIWLNKLNILFMHINFIYFQGDIVLYLVSIISRSSYRARWSFTFTLALEKPVSCTISWLLCSSKWNKVSTIASMDSSSLRPWRMLSKRSCVGVVPKHWVRRRMASGCLQNWLLSSWVWLWVWYNTNYGDAVDPRTEFTLSFEFAEFFVHFHEHILRQFFSQHGVFTHLQGERIHHVFVLIHQNGKCMTVAR